MHYANETQLSALKELGFTPTEDKTTLTEVAQWLWEKHKIECGCCALIKRTVASSTSIIIDDSWEFLNDAELPTIPEALSWAIGQAIKYLQENAKQ